MGVICGFEGFLFSFLPRITPSQFLGSLQFSPLTPQANNVLLEFYSPWVVDWEVPLVEKHINVGLH